MLAQKRSRSLAPTISTTNGGGTNISPSAEEASAASGKLCHELSSSLQTLLLNINNNANSSTQDVYHQFLNSPPQNDRSSNNSSNSPSSMAVSTLRRNGEQWLTQAMEMMGVNSTQNIHTFWKKYGYGNEEEFMDGRYLVWFAKEILLKCSLEGGMGDGGSGNAGGGDGEEDAPDVNEQLTTHLLSVLEQWDDSIASLLNKNGARLDNNSTAATDGYNQDLEEEEDEEETAGVMWQILLQNAHLTPETLRECLEGYTCPQQEYERGMRRRSGEEEEGGEEEDALPFEYFMYPSFFRHAVLQAKEQHDAHYSTTANGGRNNKRRKSNNSSNASYFPTTIATQQKSLSLLFNRGSTKNTTDHLPLLGYTIAHALLSTSFAIGGNSIMTIQQKVAHLKSSTFISTLPQLLNIATHDYPTKNALYSGMAACVLDEVGEWIVLDGLLLGESSCGLGGNAGEEQGMNVCVCEQMRANVESIVDLFLVGNGVIEKLAKLTKTPLPKFVAETADVLLNYSEVHHRLRLGPMITATTEGQAGGTDNNKFVTAATLLKQHLAADAKHIVQFIDTSNPGLKQCLMRKKFTGSAYYSDAVVDYNDEDVNSSSSGVMIIPCNPIVVWVRACLLAGGEEKNGDNSISRRSRSRSSNGLVSLSSSGWGMPAVAKTCLTLEDCTGIADTTKQHCWLLLFERMQEEDVLFEYGWDTTSGGATLANITMGAIGLQCALDYLKNVVLEAKETLLDNSSSRTPLGGGGGRFSSRKSRFQQREQQQHSEQDLLCVKDAVRRTALKILAPRPYTPHEALRIATQLSDAANPPKLEHTTWGMNNRTTGGSKGSTAMDVACRILAAPSLYSVWIDSLEQQEEEVFEEDDLEDVVEGGVQEEQVEEIVVDQSIATAEPQAEPISEVQPQMEEVVDVDDAEPEPAVAAQEPPVQEPVAKEQDNEVIDLGDTDDEVEVPPEKPASSAELDVASPEEEEDSDQTKSIGSEADQASFGVPQEDETYPRHYHQFPGNYSGSDDYSAEDDEEEDRHLAYEGQYDEDEGRGESEDEEGHAPARPQGEENECVELLDSSEEEEEVEQQEESGEERTETDILNDKVDQYITEHDDNKDKSELADAEAANANESDEQQNNEARILSEAVHDYTLARQVGHLEDPGQDEQEEDEGDDTLQIPLPVDGESDQDEREDQEVASEGAQESDAGSEAVAEPVPALPAVEGTVQEPIDLDGDDDEEGNEDEAGVPASKGTASDQSPAASGRESDGDVVSEEREFPPPSPKDSDDEDEVEVVDETMDSAPEVDHAIAKEKPEEAESMERVIETNPDETFEAAEECDDEEKAAQHPHEDSLVDDQAEEMDDGILYSSDSDNLDTDVNMADDEHESIDTEDDKRSLNEEVPQGETFDDTEETPFFEPPNEYDSGEEEEVNATNQPSVLVAAAMSSQRQGNFKSAAPNHGQINMPHTSEPAIDGASYDNTSAAMESATDNANLWDAFDEASQGDGNDDDNADGSNIQVVARYHGQTLPLESVVDKQADADDTEEESSPEDSKAGDGEDDGQVLTDDGYVPDAEVSEVEPLDTKKKIIDYGYDAEASEAPEEEASKPSKKKPVIDPDPGYVPDAEVSEATEENIDSKPTESQRNSNTRDVRFEAVLETNIGHAASAEAMEVEAEPTAPQPRVNAQNDLDEGYIPTDIPTDDGLTEEEKVQRRISKPPPSTDDGYVPDGTLTEEEQARAQINSRRKSNNHGIDEGYLPDGHTTPGEATEEDVQGEGEDIIKSERHQKQKAEQDSNLETPASPTETRIDDTIDEGYLPSAVEGTEEERSEEEDTTIPTTSTASNALKAAASPAPSDANIDEQPANAAGETRDTANEQVDDAPNAEPLSPSVSPNTNEGKEEEATMPSILVATATALQKHRGAGKGRHEAQGGIAPRKSRVKAASRESFSDESDSQDVETVEQQQMDTAALETVEPTKSVEENAAVEQISEVKASTEEGAEDDGHQDASVEEDDVKGDKEEGGLINAELMGSGVEGEDEKEDRKLGSSFDEKDDRELEPDECDDLPIGADASDDTASKKSPNPNLDKSVEETTELKEASVSQATVPEASHLADQQGAGDSDDSSASLDETGDITSPTKMSKKEMRARGKAKAKAWHDARSSKSPTKQPALAPADTNDASNADTSDDGEDANLEEIEQDNGEGKAPDEETTSPKDEPKEEAIDASLTARSKDDQQQEGSEEEKAVDREEMNDTETAEDEVAENQNVMKSEGGEELESGNDAADEIAAESHPSEREQRELEEISGMKVVDLKAKLKKVGLPVSGRKRELQGRLTGHLYPHLPSDVINTVIGEDNASVASKSSRKRKASSSVAGTKSKQGRKPSSKIDEQQETPISEMTHQDDSDFDDDSVQEHHFAGESGASKRSKKSPGIPSSIVTQKAKGASLPVVPEGEVVEGSTIGLAAVADLESEEKPPARAKRGSTRKSKKKEEDSNDDESAASNDTSSVASSTRRGGKRRATASSAKDDASSVASDSSKRAKRSTRAKGASEEESDAIEEVEEEEVPKKSRPGRPKKAKADNEEGSVASSTRQRSTRSSRKTQAKKSEGDVDEGSVASSRRSARSATAKKGADESVATRRSTRSRAKK